MSDRSWTVTGYENGNKVFETTIPVDSIAESDVKALLQRLAARALTEEEVVAASLLSAHRSAHLELSETSGGDFGFTSDQGASRYYVATLGDSAAGSVADEAPGAEDPAGEDAAG